MDLFVDFHAFSGEDRSVTLKMPVKVFFFFFFFFCVVP